MTRIALLVLMLAAGAVPRAFAQGPIAPFAYDMVPVAPNVYTFIEKQLNAIVSGNIVAVVGTDSVLVFDSGHHPTITRGIIDEIRRFGKPVRYVVNSHWHDDHWAGNAEFAKAFPGVEFIGTPVTADLMVTRRPVFGGAPCTKGLDDQSKPIRDQLALGTRADGSPIPPASRARLELFLAGYDAHRADCEAMVWRGIDRRIDARMEVDLGGRVVEILPLGRGNTAGDLVVHIPDAGTALVGDLVVSPFPFATQAYISEWAKVLRAIEGMPITTIVPGHGPVMRDFAYVRDVRELLEAIAARARAIYKPGMTADALKQGIDLADFRERFARGDRFIAVNFDAQMQSAIQRMWEELSGNWKPEGIDGA